ncbi:MAG: RagB/SusD family nutrient uptake outer membrane protein, partial [Flavobacterium psychrophilum]
EVGTSLFQVYNALDVRRSVVIDRTAAQTGYNVLPVGKYAFSESTYLLGDIKVFRNSEMYLIRAEYYASISDYTNVAAQINTIRRVRFGFAAGTPNASSDIAVPTSDQGAWAAILAERRAELAFEGHRYLDIRRLGKKANVGIQRAEVDFENVGPTELDLNDHRWTLPVPQREKSANPNIVQNPGYGQ